MEYGKKIISIVALTMILTCFVNAQDSESQNISDGLIHYWPLDNTLSDTFSQNDLTCSVPGSDCVTFSNWCGGQGAQISPAGVTGYAQNEHTLTSESLIGGHETFSLSFLIEDGLDYFLFNTGEVSLFMKGQMLDLVINPRRNGSSGTVLRSSPWIGYTNENPEVFDVGEDNADNYRQYMGEKLNHVALVFDWSALDSSFSCNFGSAVNKEGPVSLFVNGHKLFVKFVCDSGQTGNYPETVIKTVYRQNTVDEVKYWNRALSDDEVLSLYDDALAVGHCDDPAPQPEIKKEQTAIDRDENTAITDVYRGDWISYRISATNLFDSGVYMSISDTLDRYVDYLAGSFTVNNATVSDSFVSDGLLDYEHAELINPGETLSIGFDVQVSDVAPYDWLIENVAFITAFINPLNPFPVWETNSVEARVANPVPEPSTMLLLAGGLLGMLVLGRQRMKR